MAAKKNPKSQTVNPKKENEGKTQVIPGNIPVLTIQLLNDINRNLVILIKLIKENIHG